MLLSLFQFNLSEKLLESARAHLSNLTEEDEESKEESMLTSDEEDDLDKEDNLDATEFVLAEDISLEKYTKFRHRHPRLSVQVRLDEGRIVAYELPYSTHSKLC